MAEGGESSGSDMDTVDLQILDCSDTEDTEFECVLPTQNRFEGGNGQARGWGDGNGWTQVRRSKRKKVSSSNTDNVDISSFTNLSNDEKLSSLFEIANRNLCLLNEVKHEQTTFYNTTKELKSRVAKLTEQSRATEKILQQQNERMKMLAFRSLDTEARSRRNNVIVWGISERSNMRVEPLILNFFEDEMSIDTSSIVIDRAHRVGSMSNPRNKDRQDPKRPIIVRFRDYVDTVTIMKNAYKLKGSPFGIDRDYPREIATARKELYRSEEAKHARENRDKIQIKYPAKLAINGRLVVDKFPDWHKYLNEDRIACFEAKKNTQERMHERSARKDAYQLVTESECSDQSEEGANDSVFQRSGEIDATQHPGSQTESNNPQPSKSAKSKNSQKSQNHGAKPKTSSKSAARNNQRRTTQHKQTHGEIDKPTRDTAKNRTGEIPNTESTGASTDPSDTRL